MDHSLSLLCIYTTHQMKWVVWGWFRCVLILVLVYLKPVLPLPPSSASLFIEKSTAKTAPLPIFASAAKTASLPIQNRQRKLHNHLYLSLSHSIYIYIYIYIFFWVFTFSSLKYEFRPRNLKSFTLHTWLFK